MINLYEIMPVCGVSRGKDQHNVLPIMSLPRRATDKWLMSKRNYEKTSHFMR